MTCQRRNSGTDHGNASSASTFAVPQTPGKQAEHLHEVKSPKERFPRLPPWSSLPFLRPEARIE